MELILSKCSRHHLMVRLICFPKFWPALCWYMSQNLHSPVDNTKTASVNGSFYSSAVERLCTMQDGLSSFVLHFSVFFFYFYFLFCIWTVNSLFFQSVRRREEIILPIPGWSWPINLWSIPGWSWPRSRKNWPHKKKKWERKTNSSIAEKHDQEVNFDLNLYSLFALVGEKYGIDHLMKRRPSW